MTVSSETLFETVSDLLRNTNPIEVIPEMLGLDAMEAIASVGLPPMDAAVLLAGCPGRHQAFTS